MPSARTTAVLTWVAQLVAAAILGMAATSKLTGASDAIALFTLLGVEPWGRLTLGSAELGTALLLLWPRTALLGGFLGTTLMLGAIATHLFRIGISYGGDPSLFLTACLVLAASVVTILLRRRP